MIRTVTRPRGQEDETRRSAFLQSLSDTLGLVIKQSNRAFGANGEGTERLVLKDANGVRWQLDVDTTGTLGVTQL